MQPSTPSPEPSDEPSGERTDEPVQVTAPPAPGAPSGPAGGPLLLPDAATRSKRRRRRSTRLAIEWGLLIVGALVLALVLRTYVVQAFYIPSDSMVPTLEQQDRVLVNKLSYRLHDVHRGDIVVFEAPPGEETGEIKDLVKRVIGLPGETVEGRDGRIFVDGDLLEESWLPEGTTSKTFGPVSVPPESYWVLGDNRLQSRDSTVFGPIKEDWIVGRVFVRIWPLTRLDIL